MADSICKHLLFVVLSPKSLMSMKEDEGCKEVEDVIRRAKDMYLSWVGQENA